MSLGVVNDENQGTLPVRKYILSESAADIFALDQPTGRPSILRPSQSENINKNLPKGAKVCFQTPLRDPVTKRIMSPSRVDKMASLDDCLFALESLSLADASKSPSPESVSTAPMVSLNNNSYPDDEVLIQSKGVCTVDSDNLGSKNKMLLSPNKSSHLTEINQNEPAEQDLQVLLSQSAPEAVENVLKTSDLVLDETLPMTQSAENSIADISSDAALVDNTVIIETRVIQTDQCIDVAKNVPLENDLVMDDKTVAPESPLLAKGTYKIDFDNLDSVNPFQTGCSKIPNSPSIERKAVVSNAQPIDDKTPEAKQEDDLFLQNSEEQMVNPEKPNSTEDNTDINTTFAIASVDPSETVESKIQNVHDGTGAPVKNSLPSEILPESKKEDDVVLNKPQDAIPDAENPSLPEVVSQVGVPPVSPSKEAPMILEFNFDDGEVKRKPPPKRLGLKRPPVSKAGTKKPSCKPSEKIPEIEIVTQNTTTDCLDDIPTARGAYNIDFNTFDDPNFNPFGTKAGVGSSSKPVVQSNPVLTESFESAQSADTYSSFDATKKSTDAEQVLSVSAQEPSSLMPSTFTEPSTSASPNLMSMNKTFEQQSQSTGFDGTVADDEFVHGSLFMQNDLDGQIDYLEQFGSSTFQESALRKQSLYLKFDPLLKESPKKTAVAGSSASVVMPRPSLGIWMMEAAKSEVKHKSQQQNTKVLDDFTKLEEIPVVEVHPVILEPAVKQSQRSEAVIVDVLKYSQKDLDAALEKSQKQAEEKEGELNSQIEKLHMENQHMVVIVSEFEALIAQITAEHKQKEELAQAELSKVLEEKQLLTKELNDMERSLSDVVKRLDRRKEMIDGFKKNEETLKQCAQSYLTKLKKEEQRYQNLKSHAEDKINQANKEIADVRSKMGAEVSALQVQLRREQLKVQSLDKTLEQKNEEVEALTKMCDELIARVQKC